MYRYIALLWDQENPAEQARALDLARRLKFRLPQFEAIVQKPGIAIHAMSDSPAGFRVHRDESSGVVVLGRLFSSNLANPHRMALDRAAAAEIARTNGRSLLERCWGAYVAFIYDAIGNAFVVRDPSADMPCCMTRSHGVTVIFSCMEDCVALGIADFSIDWKYAAAFLVRPYIQVRHTGLNEVSVIAPGECVEIRSGVEWKRHYYWDILGIAADDPIEDVAVAADSAREAICACVAAQAEGHERIIHHLSGGLDSSTVLAALLRAPSKPKVTCVHHFDESAGADERDFARLAVSGARASSGADCELLEFERVSADLRFDRGGPFPRRAFPARYVGYMTMQGIAPSVTLDGQTVQFTGHGGDGVFGRFDAPYAAIDYAWRHGLGRRLPRIALEAAQSRDTFYGVAWAAIRGGLIDRNRATNTFKDPPMVRRDVLETARSDMRNLLPAWRQASEAAGRLSPEKIEHLDIMSVPWISVDPYECAGSIQWVSPLTAQPVVELFARMPFYVLMADAEERTIPRRAFAQDLPAKLLARRTKSYMNDFMFTAVRQHEAFLREIFLDGILVKERILDRRILEKTLATLQSDSNNPLIRALIGPQLNLEIWLRGWVGAKAPATLAA